MDVTGQWYYARWLGGGCRLDQAQDGDADANGKGIVFSEGKLKILLHYGADGWWEGPPDSGLRVCRRERYLILQRRKGDKGRFKEFRATDSMCGAVCLCYMTTLGSLLLTSGKEKGTPSAPLVPSVTEAKSDTEVPCIYEVPEDEAATNGESNVPTTAKEIKEEKETTTPRSQTSPAGSDQDDFWPEPEAEGLPEQPSTAQDPDHLINPETPREELVDAMPDEKLLHQPQVGSYCHGVTSRGHNKPTAGSNVIVLGESPMTPSPSSGATSREQIESLGITPETDYPDGPSDASDVNLAIVEEPNSPTSPKIERVVAEVGELRTTIHGLLAVPENAELPDVPCPMAPSKSDASLLHGGSVIFDGDGRADTWCREKIEIPQEIPQEVSIVHREPGLEGFELEGRVSDDDHANAKPLRPEEAEELVDPRSRPNPLVRSHKVSGSLSIRSDGKSQEHPEA